MSQRTSKDQLVVDVVARFSSRWLTWIQDRSDEHGLLALLPTNDDEVSGLRIWLVLVELGRDDEITGRRVAEVRACERVTAGRYLGAGESPSSAALDLLVAAIDGLRLAVSAPVDPMPVERALALLAGHPSLQVAQRRAPQTQ